MLSSNSWAACMDIKNIHVLFRNNNHLQSWNLIKGEVEGGIDHFCYADFVCVNVQSESRSQTF